MDKFLKKVILLCYKRVNVLSISYKNSCGYEKPVIYVFKFSALNRSLKLLKSYLTNRWQRAKLKRGFR